MKFTTLTFSALTLLVGLACNTLLANNMVSIAIAPTTGEVTLVPRWAIGPDIAGFHFMAQNTGFSVGANNFYSIKSTAIPMGGDIAAFTYYIAASGAATDHQDVGSKLTPNSYSALTSADPDVGYGAVNFYFVHHKGTTDYFTVIVPGSGTASAVTDLKPMSGPGGPSTVTGVSGYFGLSFAAANLGYGINLFYYLRTDPVTGFTKFGTLDPALLSGSADRFDLGLAGHNALAFSGADVGYGTDKMYYVRLDPITGFTILGTLHPLTGKASDIANLGSVYSTLDFVAGDVGFGAAQFYTTGSVNSTWQSVSFAAIPDRALTAGSFTVSPSASSGLPIALTVVTGSATVSAPVLGVFTVTPLTAGLLTLQATQAGQVGLFESNMLRQSLLVAGGVPDFNADAKSDIVLSNTVTGERAIWLVNGTSISSGVSLGLLATNWAFSAIGDFNGDGHADIFLTNTATGERGVWMMNGTAISSAASLGIVSTNWFISAAGDFNGDGKSDLFLTNTVTGERGIWLMNGASVSTAASLGVLATDWLVSAPGDFNADGRSDLLLTNTTTGERAIWLVNGTTITASASLGVLATDWVVSGVGDLNGDGKGDILLTNTATGERAIWMVNGLSISSSASLGILSTNWFVSRMGDYNGDGKADVFLTNTVSGERGIWLMNGTNVAAAGSLGILSTNWLVVK